MHLIAPTRKSVDLMKVINVLKDDSENQKIDGFPDFIPDGYRLKIITFSDALVLTSVRRNDLLDLLISKKSCFLSQIKLKKQIVKIKDVFKEDNNYEFIIINHCENDSNLDDSKLTFFNSIMVNQHQRGEAIFLDYNKSRKFVNDFNKEIQNSHEDYYTSGF